MPSCARSVRFHLYLYYIQYHYLAKTSLSQTHTHAHATPLQKEPTGQGAHVAEVEDVTLPMVPGGHAQARYVVDPGADTEGPGHGVHDCPLVKVLAGHEVEPGVHDEAPVPEEEPAGHVAQGMVVVHVCVAA